MSFLALLLMISLNVFCIKPVSYTSKYINSYGVDLLEISTKLSNDGNKTITRIKFSVVFKNKLYQSFDVTAPIDIKYSSVSTNIVPTRDLGFLGQKTVSFTVNPPSDPNMVLRNVNIEQVIYEDGTYKNY